MHCSAFDWPKPQGKMDAFDPSILGAKKREQRLKCANICTGNPMEGTFSSAWQGISLTVESATWGWEDFSAEFFRQRHM